MTWTGFSRWITHFKALPAHKLAPVLVAVLLLGSLGLTGCAGINQSAKLEAPAESTEELEPAQEMSKQMDNVASAPAAPASEEAEGGAAYSRAAEPIAPKPNDPTAYTNNQQATLLYQPQIIRTANVSLRVDRIDQAMNQLEALVFRNSGLITNQTLTVAEYGSGYRSGNLEVRVPQTKLDSFLDELAKSGKVLSLQVTGQDVGAEIVDTESRIKNLKAEEVALQAIMKRAGKIPEVLEVSRELARVRGEIEQAQGRVNYLRQQVAYSTVRISLSEEAVSTPADTKSDWGTVIENAFKRATNALDDVVRAALSAGVWFVIFLLPMLLLAGGVLYGLLRLLIKLCRKCFKPATQARVIPGKAQAKTHEPPAES